VNFLWDAKHALVMLQLNFHEFWMSDASIINSPLYMLYIDYPFVYFDISKSTCLIELKILW
jgi:hypothetical protein